MPHSSVALRELIDPSGVDVPSEPPSPRGAERRTEPRFTPSELRSRLVARHKYGESVTLIDLSVGGVQFETPRLVRPDVDVVLEIIDARTQAVSHVISRVLRANVAGLAGGIRYRAACAFRRPLSNPALLAPSGAPAPPAAPDFLKLELELKTIVDAHVRRPRAGAPGRHDAASLVEALAHLRAAADRRRDPVDRQLGVLLAATIPALERREPTAEVLRRLHDQLAEQLPVLALRTGDASDALAHDCESITLNMGLDANAAPMTITADFPSGFGLDASQFRLLKLSGYLVGLIESWNAQALADAPAAPLPRASEPLASSPGETDANEGCDDLPTGWHRVVLHYGDGQLVRGYSNDFNSDRSFVQICPSVGCPADERMMVPVGRLKALFFVRDLHGDRNRVDVQTFDHTPRGRKIQVTFRDGESMTGSTLSYKPNGQGFFMVPANIRGNNVRAYVVTAAIRHVRFV
jgi:hypothetical protein